MRRLWPLGALYLLGVLAFAVWGAAQARSAEMCAPGEPPVVCVLKEQRNNAMDDAVVAEGKRRFEANSFTAEREYWRQYVQGIDAQSAWWLQIWSGLQGMVHAHK